MNAANQSDHFKASLLIRITSIAWLAAKAISWKLWIADRFFPVIPVSDYFPEAIPEIHFLLFILSLGAICGLLLFPKSQPLAVIVVLLELSSCILDQMRWQPWEFQYLLTLVFLLFSKDRKQFLSLLALLLTATYIFSGAHKFCGAFLYTIWDKLILKQLFGLSAETIRNPIVHYAGLLIPIAEIGIGFGLLLLRNKKWFIIAAVLLHAMVIFGLSPLGVNQNYVVLPWNVAMLLFVILLFRDNNGVQIKFDFLKNWLNLTAVVIVGVLPTLGLFGYWDSYLSFNLYSGNTNQLMICSDNPNLNRYKTKNKRFDFCENTSSIDANRWALDELKVPIYPEERAFINLKNEWKKRFPNEETTFIRYRYPFKKESLKEIE